MATDEGLLSSTKSIIKCLVISSPQALTLQKLNSDYKETEGCDIPFGKLGFKRLDEFVKSIPDILSVYTENCILKVEAAVPADDSKARHIYDLVKNQKKRGSRNPPRSRSRNRGYRNNQTNNGSSYQSRRYTPPPPTSSHRIPPSTPHFTLPLPNPSYPFHSPQQNLYPFQSQNPYPFQSPQQNSSYLFQSPQQHQFLQNYQNTIAMQRQFMNMNMNAYPNQLMQGPSPPISQNYSPPISQSYSPLISQNYSPLISQNYSSSSSISQNFSPPIHNGLRRVITKTPPPPCLNKPAKLPMNSLYDMGMSIQNSRPSEPNPSQNSNTQDKSSTVNRSETPVEQAAESVDSCSTVTVTANNEFSSSATTSTLSGSHQSQSKYKIPIVIHTKKFLTSNDRPTENNDEPATKSTLQTASANNNRKETKQSTYIPPRMTEIVKCEFRRKAALIKNKEKLLGANGERQLDLQENESISSDRSAAVSEMNISASNGSQSAGYDSGDEAIPTLAADDIVFRLDIPDGVTEFGTKIKTGEFPESFSVGALVPVFVTEVHNPFKFWFQIYSETKPLDNLMNDMEQFYTNLDSTEYRVKHEHCFVGQICAALYSGLWHRGEIVSIDKSRVKIYFVDYGTTADVHVKHIKFLMNEFSMLPSQAYRGSLDFIKPKSVQWERDATFSFLALVSDLLIYAKITHIDKEERHAHMILTDTNKPKDVQINETLINKGYAKYFNPYEKISEKGNDKPNRHFSEIYPTFKNLENGTFPSFAEIGVLLSKGYDVDTLLDEHFTPGNDLIDSLQKPTITETSALNLSVLLPSSSTSSSKAIALMNKTTDFFSKTINSSSGSCLRATAQAFTPSKRKNNQQNKLSLNTNVPDLVPINYDKNFYANPHSPNLTRFEAPPSLLSPNQFLLQPKSIPFNFNLQMPVTNTLKIQPEQQQQHRQCFTIPEAPPGFKSRYSTYDEVSNLDATMRPKDLIDKL